MSTYERVRRILADILAISPDEITPTSTISGLTPKDEPYKTITPESDLVSQLGADSLNLIELILALEEEFDIEEFDLKKLENPVPEANRKVELRTDITIQEIVVGIDHYLKD